MVDPKMNRREFAMRCKSLHDQVHELIGQETLSVRMQVLLSSLFVATEAEPLHEWGPVLAIFLTVIGQRDGVYFYSSSTDDDNDNDEERSDETLH